MAFDRAVGAVDDQRHVLLRHQLAIDTIDVEGFAAVQPQRADAVAILELQRQHAHADQVRAVDALEAAGDDRPDSEQHGALGRPVARRAGAVFLASQHHGRNALLQVRLGRVVDRGLTAVIQRETALDRAAVRIRRQHQVLDPHIGEGAADHDVVVAAPAAVAVEIALLHAVLDQIAAGRGAVLERTGRADMVGGHRVAEQQQRFGAANGTDRIMLHAEAIEERRPGDIGRLRPVVDLAGRGRNGIPQIVVAGEVAVLLAEDRRVHRDRHQPGDFIRVRPDIAQIDRMAVVADAERLGFHVDIDPADNGEGNHQRRAGKEVGAQVRVNARLEVAVAGQNGGADQIVLDNCLVQLRRDVTGVADTGGAAESGDIEAERFQRWHQPGGRQVLRHHARTGAETGLDPRMNAESFLDRLFRQQAGGEQHAGVRGIGAAGDGGDQHIAMADILGITGDDMALAEFRRRPVETAGGGWRRQQMLEGFAHFRQGDAVLRPFRARQRRRDGVQVEGQRLAVVDVAGLRDAEQALGLEIRLEQFDFRIQAAGAAQVVEGLVVDREEAHGRAVFRRHVGDGRAVGHGQAGRALAEEFDELADHLLAPQQFGHRQYQVGRGHALAQLAGHLDTDHVRRQEIDRLSEHGGLGLDAADPPADHADAIDHRRVAVGADQGVRVDHAVLDPDAAEQILEVHLVDDADAGRDHLEGVERLHPPFHELVALAVALEFQLHVLPQRFGRAVVVDHHRVVNHQVDRHQRFDGFRVLAQPVRHIAHGGQVAEQRHAGEILQHHARDRERDLVGSCRVGLPVGQLAHVLRADLDAVTMTVDRFQHQADRHRQAGYRADPGRLQRRQARIAQRLAGGLQGGEGREERLTHGNTPVSGITVLQHGTVRRRTQAS